MICNYINKESSLKNPITLLNFPYLYNNYIESEHFFTNPDMHFKSNLLKLLTPMAPIFSFFIYSVDKNVRKFSRGKSGKYMFV